MARRKIDKAALANLIRNLEGLDNEQRADLLQLLNEQKRYGLVWEDHIEDAEELLREKLPVFIENRDKRLDKGGQDAPNHVLIEGDNLHALTALSYTHEGMVDVIYIDPPYNTGNKDFVYNDSYVDTEDGYRHSKWLSFMEKRLRIAKRLLSDRGVIFISIDDNEQANLKLLCDKVFGGENFAGDISWQRTYSPRNDSKGISNEKEHIIVFSKNTTWTPNKLPRTDKTDSKYKTPDNDDIPWTSSDACAPGAATHQGMVYGIQHPFTGKMLYPYNGACWPLQQSSMLAAMQEWGEYELKDINDVEKRAEVCGVSPSDVRQGVQSIVLVKSIEESSQIAKEIYNKGKWPRFYFTNKGNGGMRRKTYLNQTEGQVVTNLWKYTDVGHTDEAKKELKSIFDGKSPFDTPKPTRLLERIERVATNKDSIILDFFAGSGTTLHATMQLNAEDGGHRQCILVTNNENNICEEVTYERNKRVIKGYTTPKGEHVEGLKNNNLRYYKTEFVNREKTSANMKELMKKSLDILCIKEGLYKEKESFEGLKLAEHIARYFTDGTTTPSTKQMLIIYEPAAIPVLVKRIEKMQLEGGNKLLVYVMSDGQYPFTEDFASVLEKIKLYAMPYALYQAMRQVLPTPNAEESQEQDIEVSDEEADSSIYKTDEE